MAIRIVMPKLGMVMSEGTVSHWTKKTGDYVSSGEVLAEIQTEKINYELEATGDGLFHSVVDEGSVVPVDGLIGYLLAVDESVPDEPAQESVPVVAAASGDIHVATKKASQKQAVPADLGRLVRSTPGARKLASKLEVDITKVSATGPGGRVVENDVRAFIENSEGTMDTLSGTLEPSEMIPMEGIRKSIADHMIGSLANSAQLSFFLELDVTEAQRMRRIESDKGGVTIGIGHVVMKACAEALCRNPRLNSVLHGGNILHYEQVNIGMAVALKDGLIVPVIRAVEGKSIRELVDESTTLASKARDSALSLNEVAGGTFTVSVLGSVDGFTPILNAGQSAILGVGRSVEKPVVREGKVVVKEMMTVSLTVDHQVIDGAVAAAFLRRFQQIIERPRLLFK